MKRQWKTDRRRTGESWQIIYMDLMTMIMVFFVILWSINQGKDDGISDTVGDVTTRMIHLPGDVLFAPGKSELNSSGKKIIGDLFGGDVSTLEFDKGGLVKRMLFVHGHTDSQGDKSKNIRLGFERALSAYEHMRTFGSELRDHVVICTHADNSPMVDVPTFGERKLSQAQKEALHSAHQKNRRITIEDKLINQFEVEE